MLLLLLIQLFSGVWITTTDSFQTVQWNASRFITCRCCERCVHQCTLSPSWLPLGYLLLRKPLRSDVRPDENPRLGPLRQLFQGRKVRITGMGNRDSDWLVKLNIIYLLWIVEIKYNYCGLKTLYAHQAPKPDPLSFICITGSGTRA